MRTTVDIPDALLTKLSMRNSATRSIWAEEGCRTWWRTP